MNTLLVDGDEFAGAVEVDGLQDTVSVASTTATDEHEPNESTSRTTEASR
ncbi:hypothetical protein [Haloferax sp. DFSO52]